ncbi:serine protease [Candidatus Poriferisodalis sp.]|uniref:serine protease n=1 Tax=Candidatus Poriferisodalis sp. TaxID=3101277 RepID=UPI003B01C06F
MTAAFAVLLAVTTVLASPAAAHEPSPRTPPQAKSGNCNDALPIVVASDAGAQSDMYSAVTLAGALGTQCIILAGARGAAFPAAELECLKAAAKGGYVVGGKTAVPDSKLAGRSMTRIAGRDRWATAEAVGAEVQRVLGTLSAAARKQNAGTPVASGGRGCGTTADRALSASEILAKVGPSIPAVAGCLETGSGILIDGGYVLTGYQTVGQCETVNIFFPDGSEHADVPVAARVPLGDYAVLGPIRTTKKALTLHDGEQLRSGSRLYGIDGRDTRPSIQPGRLAQVPYVDSNGFTLLKTDAALKDFSSGDVLVDEQGRIVGVFTSRWGSTAYGLAFSTAIHAEAIPSFVQDDPVDGGWVGLVDASAGAKRWNIDLTAGASQRTFVIDNSYDGEVDIRLSGCVGGAVWVADSHGSWTEPGDRSARYSQGPIPGAEFPAPSLPTFATVYRYGSGSASCRLTSNVNLYEYFAGWNGSEVILDEGGSTSVSGLIEHDGWADFVAVRLARGDTLRAWADSFTADTNLVVYDDAGNQVAGDDDNGPPDIFGNALNPELSYRVPASGLYFIEVGHLPGSGVPGAGSWTLFMERTR